LNGHLPHDVWSFPLKIVPTNAWTRRDSADFTVANLFCKRLDDFRIGRDLNETVKLRQNVRIHSWRLSRNHHLCVNILENDSKDEPEGVLIGSMNFLRDFGHWCFAVALSNLAKCRIWSGKLQENRRQYFPLAGSKWENGGKGPQRTSTRRKTHSLQPRTTPKIASVSTNPRALVDGALRAPCVKRTPEASISICV